jgi:hypothetical protein
VRAFKHSLALLISVARRPFLVDERASLEEKVDQFTRLMARSGIIDWDFAAALQETPIKFIPAGRCRRNRLRAKTKRPTPFARP